MANLMISDDLSTQLGELASELTKPAGTLLFRRGDPVSGIFLIRNGKVKLWLDGEDHAYPPRILGPGSVLGLPATLSGSPYSLTAEVTEKAKLAFVPRDVLVNFLRRNASFCFQLMGTLSDEISDMRAALAEQLSGQPA